MRIVIQQDLAVFYAGNGLNVRHRDIGLGAFGKESVPEMVRGDLNAYDLAARLLKILTDPIRRASPT